MTRTGVHRFRCVSCARTYSGLTGTPLCGLHRHDLVFEVIRDMISDQPLSCRKLAARLGRTKDTVWRWRLIILQALKGPSDACLAGIVEADETYQRESRKGSREWVRHIVDPKNHPKPPRLQWHRYRSGRIKMMRGLSRWQLPIMTAVDRSGKRFFERIGDTSNATIIATLSPVVARDAVLCSDRAQPYAAFARFQGLAHHRLSSAAGLRVSGAFHIQNVNALHSRYREFIARFRGPASKYLDGYLRWFLVRRHTDATAVLRCLL